MNPVEANMEHAQDEVCHAFHVALLDVVPHSLFSLEVRGAENESAPDGWEIVGT